MANIYISVVSHGHGNVIMELDCLSGLAEKFSVVIKSNVKGDLVLLDYCKKNNIELLEGSFGLGFGHNNNEVYKHCSEKLGLRNEDLFIILNPDVFISTDSIKQLEVLMDNNKCNFASINLYKDPLLKKYDNNIRYFPRLVDFFSSFLKFSNKTVVDKSAIKESTNVDWAAGSFLAFRANHYFDLGGFDQSYFMYCEDIDICLRSFEAGVRLMYFPNVEATHFAALNNRKILSKHFFWHVSSVFRYCFYKLCRLEVKSCLKSN